MTSYRSFREKCQSSGGKVFEIGRTVLGYPIPLLSKGEGKERLLLVGTVHAREHITTDLLIELFKAYKGTAAVDLVPMLDIDGYLLQTGGVDSLPLRPGDKRDLIAINKGADFSLWKANVRAVDLNVNFDAGWGEGKSNVRYPSPENFIGDFPESEPETKAIVRLLKEKDYALAAAYHTKGEEVYYGFRGDKRYKEEAERLSDHLKYTLKETPDSAGGLKDFFTLKTGRLGLTIEAGSDSFPHPYPESELKNLSERHAGSIELLTETARELWTKYT
jgi:Zinc carboxypeptidase.